MTDIEDDVQPPEPGTAEHEASAEPARAPSEQEKRLRRELVRVREQVRQAQTERDAVLANAHRDRDAAVAQAREESKDRIIRTELKAHALRAGIVDLDGLRLADVHGVTVGDGGDVVGAEEAVAGLKSAKPYLFASTGSEAASRVGFHRAPSPATPQVLDARTLSREAWQAERAKLVGRH